MSSNLAAYLSVGLTPRKDSMDVAHTFSISRSKDEFFLEKHPKLAARKSDKESWGFEKRG